LEVNDFAALRIGLASPEEIMSWSHGEVLKPETINYRTLRPERDGLFCERIFGPQRDWECACGKYKRIRYKGIVCEKCGVEVAPAKVRRERMGHIGLASPVAHIWYVKGVPSRLGLLLNMSPRNLERILYFAQYVITSVDEEARQRTLQRKEKELAARITRLEGEAQEAIDALEMQRDERLDALALQQEAFEAELEESFSKSSEGLIAEANKLQERLEARLDQKATKAVTLGDGVLIADKGEVITRDHLKRLNELVQKEVGNLETKLRREREQKIGDLTLEKDQVRHSTSQDVEQIREKLRHGTDEQRSQHEAEVQELKGLEPLELISETEYYDLRNKWGNVFRGGMGAEALREIVGNLDLDRMVKELRVELRTSKSKQKRKKAAKRLRVAEAFRRSGNKPEWMIMTTLPVIPPELRPMVQLDGGRFATSDLNDLYRRVINRNNRLRRLLDLGAPDVIVRNEKRMLQEAVDSLIDNGRRGRAISRTGKRKLKSLSDMLKGKQGRFRRNLLGKRVDYSGRSVIVVGPDLELHQCGLPKRMALELFRPFVMRRLVEFNFAHNIKSAKRLVDRLSPEVWDVLEEIAKERPVLLNRAPTLHRLGIQAFEVVLIEGSAIQIHPLVCPAFNADFDGDQMAVHVPLSKASVEEARSLMLSSRNLLLPANGEPVVGPSKDMVLGCYYLTVDRKGAKGENKVFADFDEVALAYSLGVVDLQAWIKVAYRRKDSAKAEILETTAGRVLFNQILPEELQFVNRPMDKGALKEVVALCHRRLGTESTAKLVDRIKEIGFRFATQSGFSIAVSDIVIPDAKHRIVAETAEEVEEIERQYRRGLITEGEQYSKIVDLWTRATDEITEEVRKTLILDPMSTIGAMSNSGAVKGGAQPIRQLAGMRGLMADPSGRIIALPIRSNFREGLTAAEYFISTHGARKGLADTALRTADAGYLTRRLVDVAQDVIISEEDCGTRAGIWVDLESTKRIDSRMDLKDRTIGRMTASDVVHPKSGKVIVPAGEMIDEDAFAKMAHASVTRAHVRSPLTCRSSFGLCRKCYGRDLARGTLVEIGESVGIIAAQSIGEPGTQLTLRTFHTGGVASAEDITQGLPRVEELFESRIPKGEALMAEINGTVDIVWEGDLRKVKVTSSHIVKADHEIPDGYVTKVEDGEQIQEGAVLAEGSDGSVASKIAGQVHFEDGKAIVRREEVEECVYDVPPAARLRVERGMEVKAGDQLTEGAKNPREVLRIQGREAVQIYLLEEVQQVYRGQGVTIHDKHIEIIIRQILRKVRVKTSGDTDMLPGELVDRFEFERRNEAVISLGGKPGTGATTLLGITKAALNTESFLAAASFQETTRVLTEAAIGGAVDELRGLKENVIIGKLIPVGSAFRLPRRLFGVPVQIELGEGAMAELGSGDEEDGQEIDDSDDREFD
jgi:DNA-directed RNA polymerase subunit beta'